MSTNASLPELEAIVRQFAGVEGGMLPALHAVQHHARYISKDLIPVFADVFNFTVSEVHGVITFYKDFRTEEPAGPIVQVCRAEACQSRGGRDVWDRALLAGDGKKVVVEEEFANCTISSANRLAIPERSEPSPVSMSVPGALKLSKAKGTSSA